MAFAAITLGAAHELMLVLPRLYAPTSHAPVAVGAVAFALGALVAVRRRTSSYVRLAWLLSASAALLPLAAVATFWGFGRGFALALPLALACAALGALLGASAIVAALTAGRTLARLDAVWRLANPFRLLAIAVACGVAAGVAATVGSLRSCLALGMALGALAAWAPALGWYLERRPQHGTPAARFSALAVVVASGSGFFGAEALLPMSELRAYPNPVVYYRETDRQRFSVTSGQAAFELRIDGKLKASTVDERRYFEALVHPAMALARRRERVLLVGGGTGLAEREVLRHEDVTSLTVLVIDRALVELSRNLGFLAKRSHGALRSPKLRVIEGEPIVWLGETNEQFDVVLVDLPDPESYLEGKSYSRYFYGKLAEHMAPGAVAAIQAASPFDTPRTFAGVLSTVRAAGLSPRPYHAAVPTIGDWGFVLASQPDTPPEGALDAAAPFLSGMHVRDLAHMPRDMQAKDAEPPSLLHDQRVVDSLHDEHGQ